MEEELLESLRTSDPSFTKLHLVFEPSSYFSPDDEASFASFLQLLRQNTSVTYVLLERRLARALPRAWYERLLRTIFEIPRLGEAEIWSQRLSWPVLWSAIHSAKELRKLGLGMVTLMDVAAQEQDPKSVAPHETLETFYLSDFRLIHAGGDEALETEGAPTLKPLLDPLLPTLGACPKLQRVEINSFALEYPVCSSIWPLLSAPSLSHVTLRRLHLPASAVARNVEEEDEEAAICPLRILDVSENPLRDEGCACILHQTCQSNWRTTLHELNLKGTMCTMELAPVLETEFLADHDAPLALEKLNLAANTLHDSVARSLAGLLERPDFPLKHLELNRCLITNAGMAALAKALTKNTQLRHLGLAYNDFDDEAYVSFGRALARDNRTLESINLQVDRKKINHDGAMALQEMCRENTTILDVSTLLNTVVANAHGKYGGRIRMYLRLNKAGRVKIQNDTATFDEWLQILSTVSDDLFGIHFLLRVYPNYAALAAKQLHIADEERKSKDLSGVATGKYVREAIPKPSWRVAVQDTEGNETEVTH